MKKIMLIGKTGAGKTTLVQTLLGKEIKYQKTQAITYCENFIDVPGEYLESRKFYSSIIQTSVEAKKILLLHDSTNSSNSFPPGFSSIFTKPAIGVITKIDNDVANIRRSELFLKNAGVSKVYYVDLITKQGLEQLLNELAL